MVGNGQQLECRWLCEAVTIDLQTTSFTVDLYVLPIVGANIILGVQWLQSLSPVLIDYTTLTMHSFTKEAWSSCTRIKTLHWG